MRSALPASLFAAIAHSMARAVSVPSRTATSGASSTRTPGPGRFSSVARSSYTTIAKRSSGRRSSSPARARYSRTDRWTAVGPAVPASPAPSASPAAKRIGRPENTDRRRLVDHRHHRQVVVFTPGLQARQHQHQQGEHDDAQPHRHPAAQRLQRVQRAPTPPRDGDRKQQQQQVRGVVEAEGQRQVFRSSKKRKRGPPGYRLIVGRHGLQAVRCHP